LIADLFVHIGQQRVGQLVFGAEFGLRLGRIAADAEHHGARGQQFFEGIAEAAGLDGAARRVRLGIKEEHHRPASEIGEAYGLVFIAGKGKIGNFFVHFHWGDHLVC